MTKEEVLKIHTDVFYGSLKSQNYAALEELYSDDCRTVTSRNRMENRAHFRFIAVYLRVGDSIRLVHFQSTTLAG